MSAPHPGRVIRRPTLPAVLDGAGDQVAILQLGRGDLDSRWPKGAAVVGEHKRQSRQLSQLVRVELPDQDRNGTPTVHRRSGEAPSSR